MTWTPPEGATWKPGPPAPVLVEEKVLRITDPQGGPVRAWSASTLDKFDSCPYSVFLAKVKKIPEPGSEAMDRGSAIHKLAEDYVMGEIDDMPKELEQYAKGFDRLRENYTLGMVEIEQDWAFDIHWKKTGWVGPDTWARMKLDVFEKEDDTSAVVIDHKTGRKWGNEIKHNRQALTYAVGALMRYPDIEYIKTEFWYLDQKDGPLINSYSRSKLGLILPRVHARGVALTSCTDFKPKPSATNCKWCHYAKGDCEWAYQL